MLQRALPLAIALLAITCPPRAAAQTAPVQYGVCASQLNLPTVYVSGVLQGPASSAASVRAGFTQFLAQRYGYKGTVVCAGAANAAAAAKLLQDRANALRNAKKNVIETGWAENAAPAAKLAAVLGSLPSAAPQGAAAAAAPTRAAGGSSTATGTAGAAGSGAATGTTSAGSSAASGSSELTGVLASIFGSGSSSCAGGAAAKPQSGAAGSGTSSGAAGSGASNSGGTASGGCQSTLTQVSSALSSAFAQKPASAGASADSQSAHTAADGLGSAQAQNTRLVVYGCGRQDTQVACVTELTNQNQADTLVHSTDLWKDTFIVDDRGDRHARSRGFFLNIDGDQRTQLDISYGKSARFILMFDDVQPKVQKVTLRSQSGGLDVEDITLITSGAASDASH
jgi:hypothetical protein